MSRPPLHVGSFGGGVALAGSAEQRRIDEVLLADSFDIASRGALVAASDVTNYVTLQDDGAAPAPVGNIYGFVLLSGFGTSTMGALCQGLDSLLAQRFLLSTFARQGASSPIGPQGNNLIAAFAPAAPGIVVTHTSFPGTFVENGLTGGGAGNNNINIVLICLGAREGFAPNTAPGLYVAYSFPASPGFVQLVPISLFDALGTGANGELPVGGHGAGTNSKQLTPRGVISYNNHVFIWGVDFSDTVNRDGPNRAMFCNLGNPLKWGNDNVAAVGTDRAFTDSDAVVMGDAGEILRGAIRIFGRLFFGTNRGLHYIAGYGRDSFLTDGATPVMKAFNIVGPNALIEGPDKILYGVSDQGLWNFDGVNVPQPLFLKLVDFDQRSNGYWDLIWTDNTRTAASYPGVTNQDLVWTAVDWDRHQVLVGIPWCNATLGYGYGLDTVIVKYHTQTGGFTRQVFPGVQYTAVGYFRREGQQPDTRFLGTATVGQTTVQRYAYKATPGAEAVMPTTLPSATFGNYAPFGADGRGSLGRVYLTLAWASATSLPIVFQVLTTWDTATSDNYRLTISSTAPVSPATNDLWLDTSLTDSSIGNGTAGVLVVSFPEALLKRWSGTAWKQLPGVGSNGTRATIRLPLERRNGTRFTVTVQCVAASGRFQLEGLGEKPDKGTPAE